MEVFRLSKQAEQTQRLRLCISCRKAQPYAQLIKLTVNHLDGKVVLTQAPWLNSAISQKEVQGRSAYICAAASCIEPCFKGTRLKFALSGRKRKDQQPRRLQWPLEAQLINLLASKCTEPPKTCQNTQKKENTE